MTYRNRKLLDAAKQAPVCFLCEKTNDGTVVACHSNQIRDGKGTGHKASDVRVAFLCHNCHAAIDHGKEMNRTQKIERWELAHRSSIGWLFESGIIDVVGKAK